MHISRCGTDVVVRSPAKLNLVFEVLAKRSDGFHEVRTLMTAINLFDTLVFSFPHPASGGAGRVSLECRWATGYQGQEVYSRSCGRTESSSEDLPEGTDNIVVKAVQLLASRAGVEADAHVRLVKLIPSAAGLGGGSSNAAAALLAANLGWNLGWSRERLARLAAELGSDVAFFFGPGSAVCHGRGEQIEPITDLGRLNFVVVRPPAGLSTREVYQSCRPADQPVSIQPMLRALRNGDLAAAGKLLANRLQPVAERLSPWVSKLKHELGRLDCLGHQMTGSGSGYFGFCRHARHARRVAQILRGRNVGRVFRATSIRSSYWCA